jgi:hypothetical protein
MGSLASATGSMAPTAASGSLSAAPMAELAAAQPAMAPATGGMPMSYGDVSAGMQPSGFGDPMQVDMAGQPSPAIGDEQGWLTDLGNSVGEMGYDDYEQMMNGMFEGGAQGGQGGGMQPPPMAPAPPLGAVGPGGSPLFHGLAAGGGYRESGLF